MQVRHHLRNFSNVFLPKIFSYAESNRKKNMDYEDSP